MNGIPIRLVCQIYNVLQNVIIRVHPKSCVIHIIGSLCITSSMTIVTVYISQNSQMRFDDIPFVNLHGVIFGMSAIC